MMFGRDEFRPVIDGLTIGLQVLLTFVGTLTLGIGGVGVMNIMLVSVDERIREIGLRRALGAKKWQIKLQFLAETLLIMLLGGAAGVLLSYAIAAAVGTLPLMGPLFEDDSGKADIHLQISLATVMLSTPGAAGGRSCQRPGAGVARLEVGSGGGAEVRVKHCHPEEAESFATRQTPDEGPAFRPCVPDGRKMNLATECMRPSLTFTRLHRTKTALRMTTSSVAGRVDDHAAN